MPAGTFLPPGLTTSNVKVSGGGTDNYVMTAVDSETIQGEANLTFDGSTLTVTGDAVVTDDLTLNTDSAVFNMGAGNDFTITHDGTTGATLAGNPITITSGGAATWSSSAGALTITSAAAATWSTAAGILTIDGDDGIVLNTGGSGDLQVNENILVGANTDGYDVKFFGNASGSYMLWDESEDDLIVIGNVGIGVAPSTGVLEIQRGSNAFSTAAAATDVDNIFLKSNVTQGDGVYGPSIAWARVSDSQRRKLAIVAKQDGADDDDVGMAIFTNPGPGASAMVERLEIGGDGQFDFKSNALGITNVGASGNDWTQNALTLAGGSAAQTMSVVTTGSSANVRLDLKIPASGTGYPEVRFIQGSGNGDDDNQMFKISYVSDPGYLRMRSENTDGSSTGADIWRVPDGQLTIDANTTWDTNVFDAYDDAAVLSPYREGRFNLTQRKQELIDMGILKEYDDGFIGYNEQRMAALLAGGIYQNRDRMDSQYDEIGKRLAKIEQALGV